MTKTEVLHNLKEKFKAQIIDIIERSTRRIYIEINSCAIVEIATYIFKNLGARFSIASGVDVYSHMEILYHFTFEDINVVITLRVKLDKKKLEIDSLTSVFKAADWIEREINELLGINFKGHPNLIRLLLPDDWPQGVYPLRRDYKEWDKNAIRDRGV
ncbi:MAG: NADH-quinone oxidoreductase subunit C [Omnitrophica bacterium]|nr:NADH-quinone oxidoreductase subunit C [Candidatus Omnitrophota bacterium]